MNLLNYSATVVLFASSITPMHALSPQASNYLANRDNNVTEDGLLPQKDPNFDVAVRDLVVNRAEVLGDFGRFAPTTRRQAIFFVAQEFLPPTQYTAFLSSICDLKNSNKVTIAALKVALSPSTYKRGYLAYNYNQPDVAAVITKFEAIFQQDEPGQWTAFFAEMKSGAMKQRIVSERAADGDPNPELSTATTCQEYTELMSIPPSP